MVAPVRGHEIYIEDIEFGQLKRLGDFGRIAKIKYRGKDLIIQTPKLYVPFSPSKFDTKYSLGVSFDGTTDDDDCIVSNYLKRLVKLDELVQSLAKTNKSWLKGKKHIYCPIVKHSLNDDGEIDARYPPKMRVKLPVWDDQVRFQLFDNTGKCIDLKPRTIENEITKGSDIRMILSCTGLWIAGSKYGVSFKVKQAQIFKRVNMNEFLFSDSED